MNWRLNFHATLRVLPALLVVALSLAVSGCGDARLPWLPEPEPPTATATPRPTITPTPTATSPPLSVSDTLRETTMRDPDPEPGASCGIVDTLDFPVGPPDADGFLARWTFGRFSSRRDLYHAGEDWLRTRGVSLGEPVYAIGHGTVTYAEPWGWGGDKGVVIVRHVFRDGRTTLSFYGHLDPPSVQLGAGDCVQRGARVGVIGQPNTRPHLHFEIRDHMPDTPGPGYWSTYPTTAGWHPPSELIWSERVRSAPGVSWTRPITTAGFELIGVLADGTVVATEDDTVWGFDAATGDEAWQIAADAGSGETAAGISAVEVDADGRKIYVATRDGRLAAYDPRDDRPDVVWRRDLPGQGPVSLAPLPDGGVAAHAQWQLTAFDRDGRVRWRQEDSAAPTGWAHAGDVLLLSTEHQRPGVHAVDPSGGMATLLESVGIPVASDMGAWIYAPDGVYDVASLDDASAPSMVLRLAPWIVPAGDAEALPDGGVLISHREPSDRRLVALDADGSLRWTRSVRELDRSVQPVRLVTAGNHVMAITGDGDALSIDAATGAATKVFESGAGPRMRGDVRALAVGPDRVVFDFRGGQLVMLDLGSPPEPPR